MESHSTNFSVTIVSTDTVALREATWTLSSQGCRVEAFSSWGEDAPWRWVYGPTIMILDARDQEIHAALEAPRSAHYVYRIALYDAHLQANPDALMELGADDLVCYPLDEGELATCLRRGARRLEFERRFRDCVTFDQQSGVANRSGFTRQLERELLANEGATANTLVVLGIDFLETIREQLGSAAVEKACWMTAEILCDELSPQDFRGTLGDGIHAVLLHGNNVSEAVEFVERVNDRVAASDVHGREFSLSAVVFDTSEERTASKLIVRALEAIARVRAWGGGQIVEGRDVELAYSSWKKGFAGQPTTQAKHLMEALPLVLTIDSSLSMNGPCSYCLPSKQLPPCVPVVDDAGHLVGVVDGNKYQSDGSQIFDSLQEHLKPITGTLRSDSRAEDIAALFKSANEEYLLVVENKKPIGYVPRATADSWNSKPVSESDDLLLVETNGSLHSLLVPVT